MSFIKNIFFKAAPPVVTPRLEDDPLKGQSTLIKLSKEGYFIGREYDTNSSGLFLTTKNQGAVEKDDAKAFGIAQILTRRIETAVNEALEENLPNEIDFSEIHQNLDEIEANLLARTNGTNTQTRIRHLFNEARKDVTGLEKEKAREVFHGITRRGVRYALYRLYQESYFKPISASLALILPKIGTAAGAVVSAAGRFFASAATTAGSAAGRAAGGAASTTSTFAKATVRATADKVGFVFPSLAGNIMGLLGILAITEGPGIFGYFVRRMTPDSIQNAYKDYTPQVVQTVVEYVFHTTRGQEKFLDSSFRSLDRMIMHLL